jgi:RHS repeat-associated protein
VSLTSGGTPLTLGYGYCVGTPAPAQCAGNNGNVANQTLTTGGKAFQQSYSYDGANRLSSASESSGGSATWSETFGYDKMGNRWISATTPAGLETAFTPVTLNWFNAATNRLTSVGGQMQYDAGVAGGPGNLTGMGGYVFAYDAENRLTSSTIGGIAATYSYDGDGHRVTKTVPSATTTYVYDAFGQLAAEYSTAANAVSGTQYLTADHLGSTRLVTNASGAAVACHDYLPFGEEIQASLGARPNCYSGSDGVAEKFTGKERDAETNLDDFGARYFAGAQGRFTSVDPAFATASLFHLQSWNGYTYAQNNPLKYVDPDGEVPINVITAGVGAAIGGVVGAAGEYANQVRTSGHVTSRARIWTAAGVGALAGGIAGFTLGIGAGAGVTAGAIETGIVTASSTVIGDFTQHRANDALGLTNPGENSTELSDTLGNAATAGIGGSVGGAVADRLFPIPNVRREIQMLQFANRRSTRAARIQASSVRAQSVALGNATIGNTLEAALQQTSNYLWSLFTGTQSQQQQPPPKKKNGGNMISHERNRTAC